VSGRKSSGCNNSPCSDIKFNSVKMEFCSDSVKSVNSLIASGQLDT